MIRVTLGLTRVEFNYMADSLHGTLLSQHSFYRHPHIHAHIQEHIGLQAAICTHTSYTRSHTHMYWHTYKPTYTQPYAHTHTHSHVHTYKHTYTAICTHMVGLGHIKMVGFGYAQNFICWESMGNDTCMIFCSWMCFSMMIWLPMSWLKIRTCTASTLAKLVARCFYQKINDPLGSCSGYQLCFD